jgi:metal-dependent HD superfamily phosphatase/phosphodiesterase
MRMNAATTVRVSRDTLAELERFQRVLQTATADETIRAVLKMQRAALIGRLSGSLKGRVTRFREADRLDTDR